MKYIIVAYDKLRVIGSHGSIPWQGWMKADLQRVKDLTMGHTIIMGRKTHESIGRPLPGRDNIVVTHQPLDIPGAKVVHSLEEAYAAADPSKDIFIFGGGQVYAESIGDVDQIYATEIDTSFAGDTYFPELGPEWKETSHEHHEPDAENSHAYDFITYARA